MHLNGLSSLLFSILTSALEAWQPFTNKETIRWYNHIACCFSVFKTAR